MYVFDVSGNRLRGPIPHAVGFMNDWDFVDFNHNSLSGTIPALIGMASWSALHLNDNQLSGSMPSGFFMQGIMRAQVLIHHNRLTGTLPALRDIVGVMASGNFLEGRLSSAFSSKLRLLGLSGVPERSGGFIGPLPPALCQASQLRILTTSHQKVDGGIPSFTSTLTKLDLHNNRLTVLPDIHFDNNATIILLDNLLSCNVPVCGNVTAKTSIIAVGNRLRYPKGDFPPWVLERERDPLLWVSGTDGIQRAPTPPEFQRPHTDTPVHKKH